MNFNSTIYLGILILLFSIISSPLGYAESISFGPPATKYVGSLLPVEKVKPPAEKKKKAKKKKRAKKLRWKKKAQKAPSRTEDAGTFFLILLALLLLLAIAGAIVFGLGIYTAPLWIAGICMMALSNVTGIIFILASILSFEGGSSVVSNVVAGVLLFFILFLVAIDFIIGLTFLIWGLMIAFPLVWIVGIILLSIAIIILLFFLIFAASQK